MGKEMGEKDARRGWRNCELQIAVYELRVKRAHPTGLFDRETGSGLGCGRFRFFYWGDSQRKAGCNMKATLLACAMAVVLVATLAAQQFTPPALPAGVKAGTETAEGEVVKVYSVEDQGTKYRSYAVKYKGGEVVVSDALAMSNNKVG